MNIVKNSTFILLTDTAESMNINQIITIRYRGRKIGDGAG